MHFNQPVDNSVIGTNQKTYSTIEAALYIHLKHMGYILYGTVHRKHYDNFVCRLLLLNDFPRLFVNYIS